MPAHSIVVIAVVLGIRPEVVEPEDQGVVNRPGDLELPLVAVDERRVIGHEEVVQSHGCDVSPWIEPYAVVAVGRRLFFSVDVLGGDGFRRMGRDGPGSRPRRG